MTPGEDGLAARFAGSQERRQLFARDVRLPPDAELVFMGEGGADAVREDCRRGHLVCPAPDCPDPRYIARGGSRRHHFAHYGGAGGHAPESFYHQVGKQLLAALVRKRQPQAEVTVEGRVENGQVADVLVRSPTGRRYAFELQYSPLTVEAWRARHQGYGELGIVDVWLFGHTPPHLRAAAGAGPGFVALTPLVLEFFRAGVPVMFLNPDEQAVATALLAMHLHALQRGNGLGADLPLSVPERAAALSVDPLSFCEPYARGLLTPTGDRLRRALSKQSPSGRQRAERELEKVLARLSEPAWVAERRRRAWEEKQIERAERAERERAAAARRGVPAHIAALKAKLAAENPEAATRWQTLQRAFGRESAPAAQAPRGEQRDRVQSSR